MRRIALLALASLTLALPASAARAPLTATRDWWPVWSPNDRDIAFTRISGTGRVLSLRIYHVFAHRSTLVGEGAGQLTPSWSPDSTKLIYSSGGVLYIVNRDGSEKHRYYSPAKAYAPAWGRFSQIAYLTAHSGSSTDLWVGDEQWAPNVIGQPSWSPDGTSLAFARDDGIYAATSRELQYKLVSVANPSSPVWSPDGTYIAYSANRNVYIVRADGTAPGPVKLSGPFADLGPLSWSRQSDSLAFTTRGHVEIAYLDTNHTVQLATGAGVGTAFAHTGDLLSFSGVHPGCTGHTTIRIFEDNTHIPALTGTCSIAGTAASDTIYGTGPGGDVILAGAGNDVVHARNRHRDTVNCGTGRDTVYADRSDRLTGCEVIHR